MVWISEMPPGDKWHFHCILLYIKKIKYYMMSSALTKNVQKKGRIRVRYSKCLLIAKISTTVVIKNKIQ